jgi:hypothetical protein
VGGISASPPKATIGHQDANPSLSANRYLMHRSKKWRYSIDLVGASKQPRSHVEAEVSVWCRPAVAR